MAPESSAFESDRWQRLVAHEIGPPVATLAFADRLARENRWNADFARRVIDEYRRFCWLAIEAGHEVTPSDAVDQAWHLHLTYSRDYWERFCPEVLGAPLHHGPTAGGLAERTRYYEQYAATLKSYEQRFGEPPPADIWPDASRRFLVDPRAVRVNPADIVMIPRRIGYIVVATAGLLLAGLLIWGVFGV